MSGNLFVSPALLGVLLFFVLLFVGLAAFGRVPIKYNLRNLIVRWPVTLLTALAFTLVVGLMTAALAFVNGMDRLSEGSGRPENVIVLADGATDELFSNLGYGDITEVVWHDGVKRDEGNAPLASMEVYIVVNQPLANARGSRKRRFVQVRGVDDPARSAEVHGVGMHPGGQWFSSAGVQPLPGEEGAKNAVQAVLGEGIARELGADQGKGSLGVGDVFDLGPSKWVVVGVLRSAGSTFDSEVWAKRELAGDMFGKKGYTTVVLRSPDAKAAKGLATDLTANYKRPAVIAQTEPEYYERLSTTNKQFAVAIWFVVIVMGIGGVFGIMNTMFAAISQRTRDIGVLRILGFARWQILTSFFLEALVLGLVGGLVGCAVGFAADGWSATSIMSSGQGGGKSVVLKLAVDANLLLLGVAFSLVMGLAGGLLPALSAMRLKPLESVR
jgi:ABC-type lipoprotein release transport system permease subunit